MYGVVPAAIYAAILTSDIVLWFEEPLAPFAIAALLLILLLIGIRNAWDLVLWMAGQITLIRRINPESELVPRDGFALQYPRRI